MKEGKFVTNPDGSVTFEIDDEPYASAKQKKAGGGGSDEPTIPVYDDWDIQYSSNPENILNYLKNQGIEFIDSLPELFVVETKNEGESANSYITWIIFKSNKYIADDNTQFTFYIQNSIIDSINKLPVYYNARITMFPNNTGVTSYENRAPYRKLNVVANNWVSDNTYPEFPYKCDITCTGVNFYSIVQVIFSLEDALSGNYAPICSTNDNMVTIYSKVNTSITIPAIKEVV